MAILKPTDPSGTAGAALARKGRIRNRSAVELAMRDCLEAWGRARWPEARICHELVMSRGEVRADLAFICPDRFVAVEIKSDHDVTTRVIHQVAMFRLASPEVWLVSGARHAGDAELIKYLLPSIGTATIDTGPGGGFADRLDNLEVVVTNEPEPFVPLGRAMLALLWVDELWAEAVLAGFQPHKRATHPQLVSKLATLDLAEIAAATCRQLRRRAAFWRADPPIDPDRPPAGPDQADLV